MHNSKKGSRNKDPFQLQTLTYQRADTGVAFITIDVSNRPVNVLTPELYREIGEKADILAADDKAIGAVIHSGKPSFITDGDLNHILQTYAMKRTPEAAYSQSRTYSLSLRKLETCGKPVAVAINGTALGGGLELALACHHRVVAKDPGIELGLPEVTQGLLSSGGGTQRLPRLIGLKQAASLILSGTRIGPEEALHLGIVQQLAAADELLDQAEQWVLQGGNPQQPWDRKGYRVPGGAGLNDVNVGRLFQQLIARVSADYRHNYPAPIAALRCLFNGTTVLSMDAALKIESREFSALTRDPVARNMIRTLFINKGKRSSADILSEASAQALQQACERAYVRQGLALAAEGVRPALIENAAFAAGLPQGPLAMAGEDLGKYAENQLEPDVLVVKQRLLCSQALAAAEYWEKGLTDPVKADLASTLGWGFPSYTGGVLSYVDTMGLKAFITLCEKLSLQTGADLKPSGWLCGRASESDQIYPF